MNLDDLKMSGRHTVSNLSEYSIPDRWIRGRLNQVIREVQKTLENYKFNEATHTLYQFVWHEFCDWYLELIKPYLYQDADKNRKTLTQETLLKVLDDTLRLLHPFMPFITEEIWQQLPLKKEDGSIMKASFPKPDERFDDEPVAEEMNLVIEIITAIRNIRGEMNVPPGEQITVLLRTKDLEIQKRLQKNQSFIQYLAKVNEIRMGKEIEKAGDNAFAVVRDIEIFVPMERSRMEEEARRLQKEILRIEKEITFVNKKLSNEQFLSKAPREVVDEIKEKSMQYQAVQLKLEESLKKIKEVLG
jgi:valyl-tRNA synthetase